MIDMHIPFLYLLFATLLVFHDHFMLQRPKLFGKVNIIVMRIFEAENRAPHRIQLACAVCADFIEIGKVIDQSTVLEDRNKELTDGNIGVDLPFPSEIGVKQLDRLGIIDHLVVKADQIRLRLGGLVVINTVYLLEVRRGDLLNVLGELDARLNDTVFILDRTDLVNTAEYGV